MVMTRFHVFIQFASRISSRVNRGTSPVHSSMLLLIVLFFQSGCFSIAQFQHQNYQESRQFAQLAEYAEEKEQYEQAAEYWEKAGRLNKEDNDKCLLRCAMNHCRNKKYSEAVEVLQQAMKKNPESIDLHVQLARAQFEVGKPLQAQVTLNNALNLDPENREAIMSLAEIATSQKQFSLQGELYHRALSVDPDYLPAQILLSKWYIEQNKDEQAEILLRSILIHPEATSAEITDAKWNIGILYGKQRQWNDSISILTSVVDQKENIHSRDWYRIAYACYQNNQIPECREYLSKALELNRSDANAIDLQKRIKTGAGHSIELVSYQEPATEPVAPRYWE